MGQSKQVNRITFSAIDAAERDYPEMAKAFNQITSEMYDLFCEKQHDYGPGNIAMGTTLKSKEDVHMSLMGLVVRMNDKINRLINLIIKKQIEPKNESVIDTFMDLANYSVMAKIVSDGKWGK